MNKFHFLALIKAKTILEMVLSQKSNVPDFDLIIKQ